MEGQTSLFALTPTDYDLGGGGECHFAFLSLDVFICQMGTIKLALLLLGPG